MSTPLTADGFDAFLSEVARAPDAPIQASHLPTRLRSAAIVADRYRVERLLGRGGMGDVYLATDLRLRRRVALKLAQSRLLADAKRGWLREAEALARIQHDNVVEVFEVGTHDRRPYIAMEWIDGETLAAWVARTAPGWEAIVACYRQAGRGLVAAHAQGVVHRDFKPGNVLRARDGRVRVIDFGLATRGKRSDSGRSTESTGSQPHATGRASSTYAAAGTLGYAAPEQLMGRPADPRSDQFALCASVFIALYGRLPYPGDDVGEILGRMARQPSMPPRQPRVPPFIERALLRGLAAAAEGRFETMDALLRALDPVANRRRRRASVRNAFALAAVPLTLAIFAGVGQRDCDTFEAEIARTWRPELAVAIEERFERTGSPMAAAAAQRALARLDGFAVEWLDQRRRVCVDPADLAVEPRHARACLDAARTRADGAVRALLEVDRAHVPNSDRIVATLRSPASCLTASSPARPPMLHPDLRRAAAPIRERLEASNARRLVGRTASALTDANKALVLATELGDENLVAEARLARGLAIVADGSGAHGLDDLRDAYWTATSAKHDRIAAQAARAVVEHVVLGAEHWAEAERWYELALSAERRRGSIAAPSWRLLFARGTAAVAAERFELAQSAYAQALQQQEREQVDPRHRIGLLNALSELSYNQIRYEDALRWAERADAVARDELPRLHPLRADALRNQASPLAMLRPHEAVGPAQRAAEIRETLYGADAPLLVDALNVLGDALARAGQLQAAAVSLERSVAIAEARPDRHLDEVGHANLYLANVLVDLGQLERARDAFRSAAQSFESLGGDQAYNLGLTYAGLGELEARAENLEGAERALDRSIEIVRTVETRQLPGLLVNRGQIRLARRDVAGALADFDEAGEHVDGSDHVEEDIATMVEHGRAYAHLALGHADLAIAAAKRSLQRQLERDPAPTHALVDTYVVTASVLMQAGAPSDAVAIARRGVKQLDAIDEQLRQRTALLRIIARTSCTLGDAASSRDAIAQAQAIAQPPAETVDTDAWVPAGCR